MCENMDEYTPEYIDEVNQYRRKNGIHEVTPEEIQGWRDDDANAERFKRLHGERMQAAHKQLVEALITLTELGQLKWVQDKREWRYWYPGSKWKKYPIYHPLKLELIVTPMTLDVDNNMVWALDAWDEGPLGHLTSGGGGNHMIYIDEVNRLVQAIENCYPGTLVEVVGYEGKRIEEVLKEGM